jgi:TonB family protein
VAAWTIEVASAETPNPFGAKPKLTMNRKQPGQKWPGCFVFAREKAISYLFSNMRYPLFSLLVFAALGVSRVEAAKKEAHLTVDLRAVLVSGVAPEYPYEARREHITGRGIVVMKIDRTTGRVASCEMAPSTGSPILDDAALATFRRWRFKPGMVTIVRCPIAFTMSGQVLTEYHTKQKSMDDELAGFLGKGAVEKGPIPDYPRSIPWTDKQGKGVYEIHVQKDGTVSEVRVLKRSGDEVFDRTVVDTLRKWRLRRGPLVMELPLAFRLTPTRYSIGISKGR